jgi:AcrR family transcriptional regulator
MPIDAVPAAPSHVDRSMESQSVVSNRMNSVRQRIYSAALRLFAEKGVTQLSVSELATAAGVARGTVYNNLRDPGALFEEIAVHFVEEMSEWLTDDLAAIDDPAVRMGLACRQYVRRAHEEPDWGRFITRFAYSTPSLQSLLLTGPGANLKAGMESGRYRVKPEQVRGVIGMMAGGVIAAMAAVLDGDPAWRSAGSDTAELLLAALGLQRAEARAIATMELPPLRPWA